MTTRVQVALVDERLIISFPYNPSDVERVKVIEGVKWRKKDRVWSCPPTVSAIRMMQEYFGSRLALDNASQSMLEGAERSDAHAAMVRERKALDDVDTSGVPRDLIRPFDPVTGRPQALMEHQLKALALGGRTRRFAYFMDQGTGKTPTLFADAVWAWRRGSIDTMIVITLNAVKGQMVDPEGRGDDELTKFIPEDVPLNAGVVQSSRSAKEKRIWERFEKKLTTARSKHLNVMVVNYEALSVNRIFEWLMDVANKRTMIAADESTRIKAAPKKDRRRGPVNRTARAIEIRKKCAAARIMTGTPVIKRPLDAWGQLLFLDPSLLTARWGSFYAFRSHFCVMGGFQNQHVLFYKNLEDLAEVLSGCSYRVMKDECVDLPPKIYAPRHVVGMAKEQEAAYEKMKKDCLVVLDNAGQVVEYDDLDLEYDFDDETHTVVKAPIVLTLMLRLQQIASGYLPVTEEVDGRVKVVDHIELVPAEKNPKMQRALEIIEDSGEQKVIVWARFRKQLDAFAALLRSRGVQHVEYHGGVSSRDKERAKREFRDDPDCKVFLGNQAAGGTGLNLQSGSVMIYLSNDHSTETRVQSEDRAHRYGQEYPVTYHDIVCAGTVDIAVLAVLRKDKSLSDMVMGDEPKEWLK